MRDGKSGEVKVGQIKLKEVNSGEINLEVRTEQGKLGQVKKGQVRTGQVWMQALVFCKQYEGHKRGESPNKNHFLTSSLVNKWNTGGSYRVHICLHILSLLSLECRISIFASLSDL